jgi:plasmid stabilization system protein ParE
MDQTVEFLDAANCDFDEAFDWYAERSYGAAIGFASELDKTIQKIVRDPARFGRTFRSCQYCKLDRYPYCVIYTRSDSVITVVAVAHAKRRPGYWRGRL